jgi:hypothetical protein
MSHVEAPIQPSCRSQATPLHCSLWCLFLARELPIPTQAKTTVENDKTDLLDKL